MGRRRWREDSGWIYQLLFYPIRSIFSFPLAGRTSAIVAAGADFQNRSSSPRKGVLPPCTESELCSNWMSSDRYSPLAALRKVSA